MHTPTTSPSQSAGEENANALSHALACALALVAMPALAQQARADEHPLRMAALVAFLGSMALMYLVSSVYHALPVGRAKVQWRRWDHAAIFVFIAGSYSPFALVAMQRGGSAWLLAAVWTLALAGVVAKLWLPLHRTGLSTAIYVTFGLLAGAMTGPALGLLSTVGRQLFAAGGLAYLGGVAFFLLGQRRPYCHFIWHLCVISGSACHGWTVLQAMR
jgi:hemolysin III